MKAPLYSYPWSFIYTLLLTGLTGCQSVKPMNEPLVTAENPELPNDYSPQVEYPVAGSLYTQSAGIRLFSDQKAYRPGDVLTVLLEELTLSKKGAKTTVDKTSSVNFPGRTLGGTTPEILDTNLAMDREFGGSASNSQQNLLRGSVSVVVQKILSSGALFVKGSKVVRLNQGDEVIYVSGIVRPEDVTQANEVSSRRLAEAKISYTGKGDAANANSMGWFSRMLNSSWFPF